MQEIQPNNAYLHLLQSQVKRVLVKNQTVAEDLKKAHEILYQVARCLHYPPSLPSPPPAPIAEPLTSLQVAQEMDTLLQEIHPNGRVQTAQMKLLSALRKRWRLYRAELLYCYEIPGLPQDNLKLESLFGRLRRHQRRISGRKSTQELLDFGQAQVLFTADSYPELLNQIQRVPPDQYQIHRARLAAAELPRQFLHRLHHDPHKTIQALVSLHMHRSYVSTQYETPVRLDQALHTE